MIFSSYSFIFIFLPIVWGGYFILHRINAHKCAKWYLVATSFVFYAIGSMNFVLWFMSSVFINYIIGTRVSAWKQSESHKKLSLFLFITGVLLNVALLGYYKYADFFIANTNALFHTSYNLRHIVLPIGISFFTFQLIAYQVDSWKGLTFSYNLLDYLLFITFFPQLIVGPIVHHGEMVPQFENNENWQVNWDNMALGLFVFSIGLGKKVLVADMLTSNAQSFFDNVVSPVSAVSAWWYSIEYTISYYFDLSGYADMAIGMGLMFNVKIPENFNSPYKARNFQDYWQRWHITLSRFLGTYIFRNIYKHESKWRNYYVATMITFLVSGFWHGAGWTFIVWGLINGFFVCTASFMKRKEIALPSIIAHFLTLLGIVLTRILFVAKDFTQAKTVLLSLVNFSSFDFTVGNGYNKFLIVRLVITCFILFCMPNTRTLSERFKTDWKHLIPIALVIGLSVAFMGRSSSFLYFQF